MFSPYMSCNAMWLSKGRNQWFRDDRVENFRLKNKKVVLLLLADFIVNIYLT